MGDRIMSFFTRKDRHKKKRGARHRHSADKGRSRFRGSSEHDYESDSEDEIQPFAYTYDPTIAWEFMKSRQTVRPTTTVRPFSPIREEFVRIVCLSDTHGKHRRLQSEVPMGDILLVAGDFTTCGHPREVTDFNYFLGTLPHRHKVVIAGNHELTFDRTIYSASSSTYLHFPAALKRVLTLMKWNGGIGSESENRLSLFRRSSSSSESKHASALRESIDRVLDEENIYNIRDLLTNCIYLEDSGIELFGIKIYGTPWQPRFDNWAFNLPRGQACLDKWDCIPSRIDILLTHTPPIGHGDLTRNGVRTGCVELLNSVRHRIRPKYHVFGHIHEGYGATTDGYTKFINCSVCDCHMRPTNVPIAFDLPLAHGQSKKDNSKY